MRQHKTNNYYLISNNKIKEKFKDKGDQLSIKLVIILKYRPKRMIKMRLRMGLDLIESELASNKTDELILMDPMNSSLVFLGSKCSKKNN